VIARDDINKSKRRFLSLIKAVSLRIVVNSCD